MALAGSLRKRLGTLERGSEKSGGWGPFLDHVSDKELSRMHSVLTSIDARLSPHEALEALPPSDLEFLEGLLARKEAFECKA